MRKEEEEAEKARSESAAAAAEKLSSITTGMDSAVPQASDVQQVWQGHSIHIGM